MTVWPLVLGDDQSADRRALPDRDQLPPVERGYWFDDELMNLSGIKSASVLKKVIAAGAAKASYVGTIPKGRRRAWTARNVFRTVLVSCIADHGRMPLNAAAVLINACTVRRLDKLLRVNEVFRAIEASRGHSEMNAIQDRLFEPDRALSQIVGADLVITNGRHVSWKEVGGDVEVLCTINSLDATRPKVTPIVKLSNAEEVRSELSISMFYPMRDFVLRMSLHDNA